MGSFNQEQYVVAGAFQKGMEAYCQEPLVLYGIGRNTEAVLQLTAGFSVVGLLDADSTGEIRYGKRVLSLEEAASLSKRIVIIARDAVVPIIFQRIKDFAKNHNISVYDYAGRELREAEDHYDRTDLEYWTHSWEALLWEIERHDTVSFDVFDTLLGRYVLRPTDLFSVMEWEIRSQDGLDYPFERLRMKAEQAVGYGASLKEIYKELNHQGISEDLCRIWCERELTWEGRLTFPRQRMVDAFQYAGSLGKRIFLTSDMYLQKKEIEKILSRHGISGTFELLVSCEERAEKSDGALFSKLLQKAGTNSVLHIGDNRFHDIEMARDKGIDTWHIWSGYDLFLASSLGTLLVDPAPDLGDRLAFGMLCAKLFEDPFALHASKGRVTLSSLEQLGYCFIGPWALGFMQWAAEQVEVRKIEQFLYPSRDGFLFYRIGCLMRKEGYMPDVEQWYFKASRCALAAASIYSEQDICHILQRDYKGTKGTLLKDWFHVTPDQQDMEQEAPAGTPVENRSYVLRYADQIKEEARRERKNYQKYLKAQGLLNHKKAAVFDFVAVGTVQHFLEKQLGKPLTGLYCATMERPNEVFPKKGDVLPAFGHVTMYGGQNGFSRIFLPMEAVLVDGDPMLEYIDEAGNPVFRNAKGHSYEQALLVHDSACRFVSDYFALYGKKRISLAAAETVINALFDRSCVDARAIADVFSHDDDTVVSENESNSWMR